MSPEARIALAKSEILAFIRDGRIPADVPTFAALHDHIDANELGALCDESTWPAMRIDEDGEADPDDHAAWMAECNAVQGAVDAWIRGGGARTAA
jgi:hypothetical protein